MPIYALRCDVCGHDAEVFRHVADMDKDLPECCGVTMGRVICAPFVHGDMQAYQAVAVDKETGRPPVIEGRKQHREFLRRNGYVELGNDQPKPKKFEGDFNVRKELTEATREVLAKHRA